MTAAQWTKCMEVQRLLPPWQRVRELCLREQDLQQHPFLRDSIDDNLLPLLLASPISRTNAPLFGRSQQTISTSGREGSTTLRVGSTSGPLLACQTPQRSAWPSAHSLPSPSPRSILLGSSRSRPQCSARLPRIPHAAPSAQSQSAAVMTVSLRTSQSSALFWLRCGASRTSPSSARVPTALSIAVSATS